MQAAVSSRETKGKEEKESSKRGFHELRWAATASQASQGSFVLPTSREAELRLIGLI